jgi:RNA polymerase sigma-70 factor, ECF subfamily
VGRPHPSLSQRIDRDPAGRRPLRSRRIDDVARAFRDERARSIAILARVLGDLDLAEDAVQDAFARALERWPRDGVPANPGAWIVATARNRAIDRIRREQTLVRKTELLARAEQLPDDEETAIPDERLELIFACCHPALAADARVALTLSLLGGLTTPEIARAFLVPEPTLA